MKIFISNSEVCSEISPENIFGYLLGLARVNPLGGDASRIDVRFSLTNGSVDDPTNGSVDVVMDETDFKEARYLVTIRDERFEIPSSIALWWIIGFGVSNKVDIRFMIDSEVGDRRKKTQAFILCHKLGLLSYEGIVPRTKRTQP